MKTIAALVLLLALVGEARASTFTLLGETALSPEARCHRRCDRNHPAPSPEPTHSPPPPLPCEPIGTKTFADGEERMMCFDVAEAPTPRPGGFGKTTVNVNSQNHGNASCAHLVMHCTSPSGETYDSQGVQPGCPLRYVPGRYYVWTKLLQADPDVCRTFTFTVVR
jgi:hypothetical protein